MTATETVTYNDVRMSCPQCGRFITQEQVREEDYADFTAYYGVGTHTWVDCRRCGTLEREPLIVVLRELTMTIPASTGDQESRNG